MTLSMYSSLVPPLVSSLGNLRHLLNQAEVHAEAHGYDATVLLDSRLYPDMFPLKRQVQIASDIARKGVARLAGLEAPVMEDNETTVADLLKRIDETIAYIEGVAPEAFDTAEERTVGVPLPPAFGGGELSFGGWPYLSTFVLPNVYFHVTIAYAILRNNGVPIGKRDFLMGDRSSAS
ncbi:MAG: DUF1993 domain-containing protein [Verrucomicrobia bacterium]|nr:DUF1993 domain-containing protein [Synechococcaceae bacterium WB6_1A_059]NBP33719.1 DUF1993 domain-containing protein [Synechococcaceae bacterium WB6_1B_055]NBS50944.1 DUF1993 domain-containing protein [Verrucomicrobiota bacterium]NBY60106.1 DUF1993 domain-containing protein [Synechococcaceae bacterium LLD_019]NCY14767.1 DUF1993 domain-containing protein [Synechococcaceae bacterium WB8_1A_041]NDD22244.1 DUF1993 domain-containing protein [Synechococcaceae bacterium WBA_3_309]NDE23205.1 DUF1